VFVMVAQVGAVFKLDLQVWWSSWGVQVGVFKARVCRSVLLVLGLHLSMELASPPRQRESTGRDRVKQFFPQILSFGHGAFT
jgi:hypothetical protein